MIKNVILILLILIMYSCDTKVTNKVKTKQINKDTLTNAVITETYPYETLSDSSSERNIGGFTKLSFQFIADTSHCKLKSIIIYKDNRKYQLIKANKIMQFPDYRLIDWNFDGYKDITVLSNCGSGGCAYWIWNYSDKTQKYYYNTELSDILGLEIDSLSESIIVHYRGGWSIEVWDTLKYINNKLTLLKGLTVERGTADSGYIWVTRTHRSLVKNRLVTKVDSPILIKD